MNASVAQSARPGLRAAAALHVYLCFVMALLFIQGSGSLLLRLNPGLERLLPWLLATLMNGNIPHALLHTCWGLFGLVVLATRRTPRTRLQLGMTFAVFYSLLGLLGILVENPFGMRLAWQENLFHLTIGPLMLVLAVLAWRRPSAAAWPRSGPAGAA